ncbi:MAG: hypothetical protein ACO4A0_10340, partial [Ilumatobacteraceae bacterium]
MRRLTTSAITASNSAPATAASTITRVFEPESSAASSAVPSPPNPRSAAPSRALGGVVEMPIWMPVAASI